MVSGTVPPVSQGYSKLYSSKLSMGKSAISSAKSREEPEVRRDLFWLPKGLLEFYVAVFSFMFLFPH